MARTELDSTDVVLGLVLGSTAGFVLGKWGERSTAKKDKKQKIHTRKEKKRVKQEAEAAYITHLQNRRLLPSNQPSMPPSHHNLGHFSKPHLFHMNHPKSDWSTGSGTMYNGNPKPSSFEQGVHNFQHRLSEIPHQLHLPFADQQGRLRIETAFQNSMNHHMPHLHRNDSHMASFHNHAAAGMKPGHANGHCGYSPLCSYNDGLPQKFAQSLA